MKPNFAQMLSGLGGGGAQPALAGNPAAPQGDPDAALLQQVAQDVSDIKQMVSQLVTEEQNEEGGETNG